MSDEKIVPITPETTPTELEGLALTLQGHVRIITDAMPKKMAGFVVLAIDEDGGYRIGWRTDPDHPFIGPTLMQAFCQEIMRRELATEAQIRDFSVRQGWLK